MGLFNFPRTGTRQQITWGSIKAGVAGDFPSLAAVAEDFLEREIVTAARDVTDGDIPADDGLPLGKAIDD